MHGGLLVLWRLKDVLGWPTWSWRSLLKELKLLKNRFSKPSSSTLTTVNGSHLTTESAKLERWAEHFASVVNCGMDVSEASYQSYLTICSHS